MKNEDRNAEDLKPMPEQLLYADILFKGAWLGIFLMMVTYSIYVFGIVTPHVDLNLVVQNWNKGVNEYLAITHSPHGWAGSNFWAPGIS